MILLVCQHILFTLLLPMLFLEHTTTYWEVVAPKVILTIDISISFNVCNKKSIGLNAEPV